MIRDYFRRVFCLLFFGSDKRQTLETGNLGPKRPHLNTYLFCSGSICTCLWGMKKRGKLNMIPNFKS